MKRTCFLLAAGLMCHAALLAQTQPGVTAFQQAGTLAAGRGGRGINMVPIPRAETGKPFSATATTQTVQTFLDGTHVSQNTAMVQYRDAEGRVRTETSQTGGPSSEPVKSIVIRDPVAGVTYRLDPARKTATKLAMAGSALGRLGAQGVAARGGRGGRGIGASTSGAAPASNTDIQFERLQQISEAQATLGEIEATMKAAKSRDVVEDLGTMTVNGVPARGTRITTVVPMGAIGNDKEFRSVSERWFSADLNLLIKSVNTDPRFGTTTYELTNISRQPPDQSLFQPPGDYNIISEQNSLSPAQQQFTNWQLLQTPPSKVIEGIDIRGMSRVSSDVVRAAILSKVGDVYDEEAIRRDFSALWKTGRFSDVQLKTEPGARGGVIVRFVVTERP